MKQRIKIPIRCDVDKNKEDIDRLGAEVMILKNNVAALQKHRINTIENFEQRLQKLEKRILSIQESGTGI